MPPTQSLVYVPEGLPRGVYVVKSVGDARRFSGTAGEFLLVEGSWWKLIPVEPKEASS